MSNSVPSCQHCGSQVPLQAMFCGNCGFPLSRVTPTPGQGLGPTEAGTAPQPAARDSRNAPAPALVPPDPRWPELSNKIDRTFSARARRGAHLALTSLDVLRRSPGLLLVPVVTALACTAVFVGALLLSLYGLVSHGVGVFLVAWLIAALLFATISTYGKAVITYRVMAEIQGRPSGNAQSLLAVLHRSGPLVGWALLTTTVGLALRTLERGRGPLRILVILVALLAQVAWSAVTFFVLPIILFEGARPVGAVRRSFTILRAHWGEGVVGVGMLSALITLGLLPLSLLALVLVLSHLAALGAALWGLAVISACLLSFVATPVFGTVLYHYATTGELALGFRLEDLAAAFQPRRGLTRLLAT